jgi:hypothetical protein
LRYDVNARLNTNVHRDVCLSRAAKRSNGKRPDARDRMIDSVLKAFALTALASIAIGAVRWLARRPTALLVVLMILGASTLLIQ